MNLLVQCPRSIVCFTNLIYANRINSRGMSRVFCDLRSHKTPRGISPVNSNRKFLLDFRFTFRKPAVCSILISQDFCKGLNFIPDSFSMKNSVSPRITSGGCFYSQPECFSDILFCGFYDRFQSLIIITPV